MRLQMRLPPTIPAQQWYYKALKLDPKNPELLTDKAENDAALFLLNEADDGLVKALDIQPSVRIYQLIASISVQKGDYARAEVTLRAGLETFANSADLHYDLACVYRNTNRFEQAQAQVAQLKQYETSARVDALERAILQATGATVQEAASKEEPSTAKPAGHAKKKKAAPTQSAAKSKSAEASKQTASATSAASKTETDARESATGAKTKKRASATSAASKKNARAIEPTAADEVGAKTEKAAAKKPRTKKTAGNL